MAESLDKGECFIISRLGSDGSPERAHFDKVLRHLIRPAVETAGYVPRSALDLH
ncbi:MAG: hypothetical protein QOF01_3079, partial [Thermomicrobiales bacterium]|nr:hypothetical protein [Thermomicrobiales bacterium]